MIGRIIKKTFAVKSDQLEWTSSLVESTVGEVASGESSNCGRIRRLYTTTYKSLDQFDQVWYQARYEKRDSSWQTCYLWAIILDCVLNARSAYCEVKGKAEPVKDFVRELYQEIQLSLASNNPMDE